MSDIALTASVDFSAAGKQVDSFVETTSKKLSTIMAQATRIGGSLASAGAGGGGGNRSSTPSGLATSRADTTRFYLRQMKAMEYAEKAFFADSLNRRRAYLQSVAQYLKREGALNEGNYRLKWAMDAEDEKNAKAAATKRAKINNEQAQIAIAALKEQGAAQTRLANEQLARQKQIDAAWTAQQRSGVDERKKAADIEAAYAARANAESNAKRTQENNAFRAAEKVALEQRRAETKANSTALAEDEKGFSAFVRRESQVRAQLHKDEAASALSALKEQDTARAQTAATQAAKQKQIDAAWTAQQRSGVDARKKAADIEAAYAAKRVSDAADKAKQEDAAWTAAETAQSEARKANKARETLTMKQEVAAYTQFLKEQAAERKRIESQGGSTTRAANSSNNLGIANIKAVNTAENAALGVSNRIGRQLGDDPALQARLYTQLDNALNQYTNTIKTHGARSKEVAIATGLWNRELSNVRSSIAENGGLLKTLNSNANSLNGSITGLGSGFSSLTRFMLNTQVVLSSLTAAFGIREVVRAITDYEQFSATLRTVSGDTATYVGNLRFLYAEADRVGFSVGDVGNSFARLSIAMRESGFSVTQTQQAFTSLAEASRNFGLSSAETQGVVRALEQSFSKGVFQAEEIRNQLGDRLPVAMAALQAAMNKVDGQQVNLSKRFEEGTIDVQRYGLEFISQLQRMSGGADTLAITSQSLQASFGRMSTEFSRVSRDMGTNGFGAAVASVTDQLVSLMKTARESGGLDAIGSAALAIANNFTAVLAVVGSLTAAFVTLRGATMAWAVVVNSTPIGRVLTLVAAAVGTLVSLWADSATAAEDSSRRAAQAHQRAATAMEQSNTHVADTQKLLNEGINTSGTNVENYATRVADSYRRMGRSVEESVAAARAAMEQLAQQRADAIETELKAAREARTAYVDTQIGRDSRAASLLQTRADSAVSSGRPISPEFSGLMEQFRGLLELAREGEIAVPALADAFKKLGEDAVFFFGAITRQDPNRSIYGALSDIIERTRTDVLKLNDSDLSKFEERIAALVRLLEQARGNVAAIGVMTASGGDDPNSGLPQQRQPQWESSRTSRQRAADRWLLDEAKRIDLVGGVQNGSVARFGLGATSEQVVPFLREQARGTGVSAENAKRMLEEWTKKAAEAETVAGRLGSAVRELMSDMELQAEAAGRDTGAATELAKALKRLEDTSKNGRGEVSVTNAQRLEVERLVYVRLNAELDKYIRDSSRSTDANNRTAAAFGQSAEAGRAAEIRTRAYAEAMKYAKVTVDESGNATGRYKEVIDQLTPAMEKMERSERNLAVARDLAKGRDDLEVMRLEQSMIGQSTNLIEQEVAAMRARQQARGADADQVAAAERQAREIAKTRQTTEQLNNSWQELSKIGEQAFERIGTAITEAFAKGKNIMVSFKSVAKAVFSEVIQAALKMAVINPILNSLFGGNRGTAGGIMSILGGSSGGAGTIIGGISSIASLAGTISNEDATAYAIRNSGDTMGPISPDQVDAAKTAMATQMVGRATSGSSSGGLMGMLGTGSSLLSIGSKLGILPEGFSIGNSLGLTGQGGALSGVADSVSSTLGLSGSSGAFSGIGESIGAAMSTPVFINGTLVTSSNAASLATAMEGSTNAALSSMPAGMLGPATPEAVAAAGGSIGTVGQVAGGALGVIGGAYGIYSGIQKGGVGGTVGALGGAVTMAAGASSLLAAAGIIGASMGPIGWIVGAVLSIASAFLPGQKPSNMEGNSDLDLATGLTTQGGMVGKKFSQANRDVATNAATAVNGLVGKVKGMLNASATGTLTVGVGNRDGIYYRINGSGGKNYKRNEEGMQALTKDALTDIVHNQLTGMTEATANATRGLPAGSIEEIFKSVAAIAEVTNNGKSSASQDIASRQLDFGNFDNAMAELRWVRDTYDNVINGGYTRDLSTYLKSMKELDESWSGMITHAQSLGLETTKLSETWAAAAAELKDARDSKLQTLTTGIASRSSRLEGTVNGNLNADIADYQAKAREETIQVKASFRDLGLSAEEMAASVALLGQVQAKELAAIYQKYAESSAQWVYGTYNVLTSKTNQFAQTLDSLVSQYDSAIAMAKQLNISEEELTTARATALADLLYSRDLSVRGLTEGLTVRSLRAGGSDAQNQQADLMTFDLNALQEKLTFKKSLFDYGVIASEISAQMLRLEQVQGEERLAIIKKYNDAVVAAEKERLDSAYSAAYDVSNGMLDYVRSLRMGDSSPLSEAAKYDMARSDFNNAATKAANGDWNSIASLQSYADTFINSSRSYNGSGTTFIQDFDRAISALEAVAETTPDTLTASFLAKTTENQTTTLVESLAAVKEEITSLRREMRQQSLTPERVAA